MISVLIAIEMYSFYYYSGGNGALVCGGNCGYNGNYDTNRIGNG